MNKPLTSHASVRHLHIDEGADGQRLDNFLFTALKGVPKSHVYRLIRSGQVRVNKKRAKQTQRLWLNDVVRIPPVRVAEKTQVQQESVSWKPDFIYQDDVFWVVNKPSGLAVHGGSGHHLGMIESLRSLYPKEHQLELVHRLDRDTSGAILVARKRSALKMMQRLLQGQGVDRRYWLLCRNFKGKEKIIEAPLFKQEEHGLQKMVVSKAGKSAKTHFRKLAEHNGYQLVEAELFTGRTHQIRVHAQFGGFPIIGDPRYGNAEQDNAFKKIVGVNELPLFLHARELQFRHPVSGEQKQFVAALELLFIKALKRLNIVIDSL